MNNLKSIIWSPLAEETYLSIIRYLKIEWSLNSAEKFDKKVQKLLAVIQSNHYLCPKSNKSNLRKCTITPQTSLIYRIHNNNIELITFIDNRSKHGY